MIAEPSDGSVVGWGYPIRAVRVRIDRYAEADDAPLIRWYPADEQSGLDIVPVTWDDALAIHGSAPYLLERCDLTP